MHYFDNTVRVPVYRSRWDTLVTRFSEARMIGWLDANHEFPKGIVLLESLLKIRSHAYHFVNRSRGYYSCTLCGAFQPKMTISHDGESRPLVMGSAEILVIGDDGQAYFAPDMILHYIVAHSYRPPEEFLRALETSLPESGSEIEKECLVSNLAKMQFA